MNKSKPWGLELARHVTKPVEPRIFQPARPASDVNVEGSMSKREPLRLKPARPAQHASFHCVLGSGRSQPIRSKPAQPATCSIAQGPRRVEYEHKKNKNNDNKDKNDEREAMDIGITTKKLLS